MSYTVRTEATIGAFGDIRVERDVYRPLALVNVEITGRLQGDSRCFIRVEDSSQNMYFEAEVPLVENKAVVSFKAAGRLGTHWVYLRWPRPEGPTGPGRWNRMGQLAHEGSAGIETPAELGAPMFCRPSDSQFPLRHSRYANFVLDAETCIETGHEAYDSLYEITHRRMNLSRREFNLPTGSMTYYCAADTWVTSGCFLRDWIYQLPAYRFWERDLTASLERFAQSQREDGQIPDGIRYDGETYRMGVESDVEYIAVMGVWGTWRVTGDEAWLARMIAVLEKALGYIQNDPQRWDAEHHLVTRGHTCDTWDFEIGGTDRLEAARKVIATCDQSGYYLAFRMMAEMYLALGQVEKSLQYETQADEYKSRANALLWDGVKYLHHVHRTPMEHPGFDESQQLAAGNTWAMTRELADTEQAFSIIDEYRRRHQQTGDAHPWWSLQPGYPDELGYYPQPHCKQGGYANGGLLPYCGAELCRASFMHGRERYGVELLRQYTDHLKRTGNRVYVWYWPNGEPGMRTPNEVPYTGWGMANWFSALAEGLAGFQDTAPRMRRIRLSPRWAVTDQTSAYVCFRYAVNDSYFAYWMVLDLPHQTLSIEYTGSGESIDFHILLPEGWNAQTVSINGVDSLWKQSTLGESRYLDFSAPIAGHGSLTIKGRVQDNKRGAISRRQSRV